MRDDAIFNMKFVQEVEKHPCLYNTTLPEYSRRDLAEDAWDSISGEIGEPVPYCKEKWRNIRAVFLRTLKPSFGVPRKQYYLKDALKFIMPFINLGNSNNSVSNTSASPVMYYNSSKDSLAMPEYEDDKDLVVLEAADEYVSDEETQNSMDVGRPETNFRTDTTDKTVRKRQSCNIGYETNYTVPMTSTSEENPRKMFILSLLPEIEEFDNSQMKLFRRQVLQLIDAIQSTTNLYSDNEELTNDDTRKSNSDRSTRSKRYKNY